MKISIRENHYTFLKIVSLFLFFAVLFFNCFFQLKFSDSSRDPVFLYSLGNTSSNHLASNAIPDSNEAATKPRIREKNVFVVILCPKIPSPNGKNFTLHVMDKVRILQLLTMMKSAVAQTSETVIFVMMTDTPNIYEILSSKLKQVFPHQYQKKILLLHEKVWYPKGRKDLRDLYRTCATARLFLSDRLPYDSVIYIDTDTLFLRPPEELWMEFEKFDEDEMAALTPVLSRYYPIGSKVPFYANRGLNAGVMLMNLTRLDHFPGGWIKSLMQAYDRFKQKIVLADQDILNIVFKENPRRLYELSCDWNFVGMGCAIQGNLCPPAMKDGVSVLHGNSNAFVSRALLHFKTVFEVWRDHSLGSPMKTFWLNMVKKLSAVSSIRCARVENFTNVLLKRGDFYIN